MTQEEVEAILKRWRPIVEAAVSLVALKDRIDEVKKSPSVSGADAISFFKNAGFDAMRVIDREVRALEPKFHPSNVTV